MKLSIHRGRRVLRVEPGEFAPPEDAQGVLDDILVDLHTWGMTNEDIAEALGLHTDTVRGWGKRRFWPRWTYFVALRQMHAAASQIVKKEEVV